MLSRRGFLSLGVVVGGASLLPLPAVIDAIQGRAGGRGRAAVPPFSTRMPVPATLRPAWSGADVDVYQLAMRRARVEILPGTRTEILSYGGSYIGPTIRASSGRRVLIRYRNDLPAAANVHLHGGLAAQASDGYPTDVIQPGATAVCEYPNRQPGATLWYHDQSHLTSAEHVYRGLHGMYLLEDEDERRLRLPGGEYDVPIMLSDANLAADGELIYGMADAFNRTTILANGKPVPYFPVRARKYRLRLVNGSIWRYFRLSFGGRTVLQIAGDSGLLPAPVPATEVLISPGERVEIVVDFGAEPLGTQIVVEDTDGLAAAGPVLRFDVAAPARDNSRVPDVLRPLPAQPPPSAERRFELTHTAEPPVGMINGIPFDPNRVDAAIAKGATEDWVVYNGDTDIGPPGGLRHNFHVHHARFRVLDRDGKPAGAGESGWKDTVRIEPGQTVRLRVTFGGFRGRYPYHCQTIQHSHMGMMGQFQITG